uniref:Polymeric immunoglobulin receptor-like n=1 Tax=Erpetoichthys calabaricus TaxID=27687 RepID=A0A8C4S0M1_ERPCA
MKPTLYFVTCLIAILGLTSHTEAIEVQGVEGENVKIDCRYPKGFENYEKYLTDVRYKRNNALIRSKKPNTLVTEGRYTMYDNTATRVFTITIKEAQMSDAKTYWCAVERTLRDDYTEVKLTVRPGVKSYAGEEGGSVKIECRYPEGFENYEKYLTDVRYKQNNALIRANKHNTLVTDGRYSLYDNTLEKVFTVTIKELLMSDAGTYWCAVERTLNDDYTEVRLTVHPGVTSRAEVIEVHGDEGGSVKIDCRYSQGFENYEKYLTDIRYKRKNALIRANKPNTLVMEGRYSLYDNTSATVFTVAIKELQMSDNKTYWCAVERTLGDDYTEVRLIVHPVLGVPRIQKVIRVHGEEGKSVKIDCRYQEGFEHYKKYLTSAGRVINDTVIKTEYSNTLVTSGRYSLYDNTSARVYTVTIRELRMNDAGTYKCAVDRQQTDDFIRVTLTFHPGVTSYAEGIEAHGEEGGSVKIDCRYPQGFGNYQKYLTDNKWKLHNALIRSTKPNTLVTDGRYSLYDNTSARVFTVTIKDLQMSDAGTYWCAVERTLNDDYTEIRLTVQAGVKSSEKDIRVSGTEGGSVMIDCRYKNGYENSEKYLIDATRKLNNVLIRAKKPNTLVTEGRYSLYDNTSARVFTVSIKELQKSDAKAYWCAVERTLSEDYAEVRLTVHSGLNDGLA